MVKKALANSFKLLTSSRYLTVLSALFLLACLVFVVYILISVRPSDLQLVTHYTAFGVTQLYRSYWWYLLSFALFGLILAIFYIAIAIKIFELKGRDLAIAYLWLGIGILFFAWTTSFSIINVWSPV